MLNGSRANELVCQRVNAIGCSRLRGFIIYGAEGATLLMVNKILDCLVLFQEAPLYFMLTRTAATASMLTLSGETETQSNGEISNVRLARGLPIGHRESSLEK